MHKDSTTLQEHKINNTSSCGVSVSSSNNIQNIKYDSPNMKPYSFIYNSREYDIMFIKANMGLGKTEQVYNMLHNYDKVAIVSFRVSLDKQYADRLPSFELYLDIKQSIYDTDVHNKIIIQVDSFHKIMGELDLLIIDEISYTMSQLVYSEKRESNFEAFKQYITNKKTKVILMDALIEQDTINLFNMFDRPILYIENTYKKHIDKKIINYGNDYGLFKKNILEDIKNNKKIVIATNSKRELNYLESQIINIYGYKKVYSFITSDNPEFNMEDWKHLDVLGYTPTISAGVSFTEKHFDKIYGYFVNGSATAEIAVQQLFRIRNLKENEINICIDITTNDKYPTDDKELDEYIINKNKILCNTIDFIKIDHIKKDIIKDEYYYWYKSVVKKEYLSYNNYLDRILYLLKTQGINNILYTGKKDINNDKEARKSKREHIKEMNEEEYKNIYKSEILTFDEYKNINKKIKKNINEKYSCKRFNFINNTKINEQNFNPDVYKKYFRYITKLNNLAYLRYGGKNIINVLNKRLNYILRKYNINSNINCIHESKRFEKFAICLNIFKQYGFNVNKILEYKIDDFKKIDKSKIKNFILNNYKIIDYAFGLANKNWEEILKEKNWFTIIHRYLNSRLTSMFKLTLKRKTINNEEYVFINGLHFWDIVKYDNIDLIKEIEEKEINLYKHIDEQCEYKELENKLMDYINSDLSYEEYFNEPEIDPSTYYDNVNKYL